MLSSAMTIAEIQERAVDFGMRLVDVYEPTSPHLFVDGRHYQLVTNRDGCPPAYRGVFSEYLCGEEFSTLPEIELILGVIERWEVG
jgi:hypothetical protein